MDWSDLIENPKALLSYFDRAPSLERITLHKLVLLRDGPTALLDFDVGEFPQRPSPRWPNGAQFCQISIQLVALSKCEVASWGTDVIGDLEIVRAADGREITFSGEAEFRFSCSCVYVDEVSGYVGART